jgi:hypothetical protein
MSRQRRVETPGRWRLQTDVLFAAVVPAEESPRAPNADFACLADHDDSLILCARKAAVRDTLAPKRRCHRDLLFGWRDNGSTVLLLGWGPDRLKRWPTG